MTGSHTPGSWQRMRIILDTLRKQVEPGSEHLLEGRRIAYVAGSGSLNRLVADLTDISIGTVSKLMPDLVARGYVEAGMRSSSTYRRWVDMETPFPDHPPAGS